MKALSDLTSAKSPSSAAENSAEFAILFLVIAIVIIAPLTVIDTPLLADYPNHVARMHVISNLNDHAVLAERYAVDFAPLPNIAMDIAVPWLAEGLPLDVAARLFLGACLLGTLASVAFLHRVLFNQWSLYSLLAGLVVYHGSLMAGMVNFSLGIGLVPAALAVWIRLQHAATVWRILAGSLIALGLYVCHLVAAGAFGLLLLGTVLAGARDRWDGYRSAAQELAIAGTTGLLPAALFFRTALVGDGGANAGVVYGNMAWKLKALLSPLAQYNLPLDLLSFALIGGLATLAWWTGRLTVDRRMAPGLLLLAIAFLLAPKALWTGGVFDQRLAVLLALMLVASTRIERLDGRLFRAAPALLALLFMVRMGVLGSTWLEHRDDLAEMRQAIGLMTSGARVLVARPDRDTAQRLAPARHRVFHHAVQLPSLPTLAVIEKDAFVSTLYALPGQQPLALRPPYDRLGGRGHEDVPTLDAMAAAIGQDGTELWTSPQLQDWPSDFDYVVLIYGYGKGLDPRTAGLPLEPLLDGEILDLFRIVRDRDEEPS